MAEAEYGWVRSGNDRKRFVDNKIVKYSELQPYLGRENKEVAYTPL